MYREFVCENKQRRGGSKDKKRKKKKERRKKIKLLIVSRKSKGGNVNIRSKVATGEQQRESQGRQKFNISLIISSLQSGRDRSATLK